MLAEVSAEKLSFVKFLRGLADRIESEDLPCPTGLVVIGPCINGTYIKSYDFSPSMDIFSMIGVLEAQQNELFERMRE